MATAEVEKLLEKIDKGEQLTKEEKRKIRKEYYLRKTPVSYLRKEKVVEPVKGIVLAKKPKEYPLTSQQQKVIDVAYMCGIRPGISRKELSKTMVECVGPMMRGEPARRRIITAKRIPW